MGNEIHVISKNRQKLPKSLEGINYIPYEIKTASSKQINKYAMETESKVIRAEVVAKEASRLKNNGLVPDLIIGHPGWGEMLFLKHVWPNVPQIHYVEYCYGSQGSDFDFEEEFVPIKNWESRAKESMKNANVFLNLHDMDHGITPTEYQYSTLPTWARSKISVIHDGIDTTWAYPKRRTTIKINEQYTLTESDEVITFINRTFEPYRGIHPFMRSLPKVLKERKNLHVLLVGKDSPDVSYGSKRVDGQSWLNYLKYELGEKLDWDRIHLMGTISHNLLRDVYRISKAHIYLTYPFVLSWSMLEAMSCGTIVIGSATAPVEEVIKDGYNGFIVPFNDPEALANRIIKTVRNNHKYGLIKKNARQTIKRKYSLRECLEKQLRLIMSYE